MSGGPTITNAPITRAQVRAIHVALARRGIDDGTYRALLQGEFGASSCKELTRREASALLDRLGRPLANPPGAKPRSAVRRPIAEPAKAPEVEDGVVRLATKAQRDLIDKLAGEVAWEAEDGFARWLRRSLGIARVRTGAEAAKAIDGLKGLKRHGHARPPAGAGA